jgi:hypothetical protein
VEPVAAPRVPSVVVPRVTPRPLLRVHRLKPLLPLLRRLPPDRSPESC